MLKNRLIGVVTVKNGWAVQSVGYRRYLPLGKPECLVENLDRWGADEILVQVIDRSITKAGPDYRLLDKIAHLGLGTPLIYGGGIRTIEEGIQAVNIGADRVIIDSLLHDDLSVARGLSEQLGAQAVIASMPMSVGKSGAEWYSYVDKVTTPVNTEFAELIEQKMISEVLIIDWKHEGRPDCFDKALIKKFPFKQIPLIVFGGISNVEQMRELYACSNVAAVAIGNFLNYKENSIQYIKDKLASDRLRKSIYSTGYTLQANV